MSLTGKSPLLITSSDVFSDVNYSNVVRYHKAKGAFASMVVVTKERREEYGVVKILDDAIVGFEENQL